MYSIAVKQLQLRAARGVYETESYIHNEYWVDAILEFNVPPSTIPSYEDLLGLISNSFEAHFDWIETWLDKLVLEVPDSWSNAKLTVVVQKRNPAFEGMQLACVEVCRVYDL